MMFNLAAVYVLWLREMKRFMRAKSRLVGTLAMPLFFLAFFSFGFNTVSFGGAGVSYNEFLVPGIMGMGMLFTSMFAGISVLWDREFGFLKEVMVAPVSRVSIVIGRILGGTTTSIIQALAILLISVIAGLLLPSVLAVLLSVVILVLISTSFIGLGLLIASRMRDMQGFSLIMNFIIFPLFFLSGALFPVSNLPEAIRVLSYGDPLTYGIDALRGLLVGSSAMPVFQSALILLAFAAGIVLVSAYAFNKSESI